jgi:hypothetical protein
MCMVEECRQVTNAYLPTQNTNSQVEYSECLDVIFDIIVKYQSQYQIILCGNLNGTVMESRNNKHDQVLKKYITEMGQLCERRSLDMIFLHIFILQLYQVPLQKYNLSATLNHVHGGRM